MAAHRGGARHRRALARARGAPPQRPDDLLAHHRGGSLPARGAPGRGRQPRRPRRAREHDRRRAAHQDRREAGAARGAQRDEAPADALGAARARARAGRDRLEDPDAGPVGDGEGPARVVPAPADEGDPGRARRVGRAGDRGAGAARSRSRRRSLPEYALEAGRARARPLRAAAAAVRRARRDPDLPRVARVAAVVGRDRGQPRPRPRAQGARPRPLRHRAREGPHPRVPRRAQAQARRALLDPLLRGPAGRRQDVARPLDRRRDGAQLRAHLGGRRARRVGDPRPPPHLHRRAARARSSARCATRARTTPSS